VAERVGIDAPALSHLETGKMLTLESIYILVVYDQIDRDTIRVVTAYEVAESR
jgi:hypothetical protein